MVAASVAEIGLAPKKASSGCCNMEAKEEEEVEEEVEEEEVEEEEEKEEEEEPGLRSGEMSPSCESERGPDSAPSRPEA
ncbi:unnamed protein product [Merluccius merluccius]